MNLLADNVQSLLKWQCKLIITRNYNYDAPPHHPGIPLLICALLSSARCSRPTLLFLHFRMWRTHTPEKKHYSKIQSSKNLLLLPTCTVPLLLSLVYSENCIPKKYPHHFARKKDKKNLYQTSEMLHFYTHTWKHF